MTGQIATACRWTFAYRSPEAHVTLDDLWTQVQTCRSGTETPGDAPVNHPDSYDLRIWESDLAIYTLSLKDKGNLGQSFVFLRAEPHAR